MGGTQSKEPKVFLSSTPVEFSSDLVQKLDASVESDYTRSQYTEKYIQDRVAEELRKHQKESAKLIKESLETVPDISSKKLEGVVDSKGLSDKLASLKAKLDSRPKAGELTKELTVSRDAIVECLKSNEGKPLKCQEEFESFKAQVKATYNL